MACEICSAVTAGRKVGASAGKMAGQIIIATASAPRRTATRNSEKFLFS